jgi:hypothetical protein
MPDPASLQAAQEKMRAYLSQYTDKGGSYGVAARLMLAAMPPFYEALLYEPARGTDHSEIAIGVAALCTDMLASAIRLCGRDDRRTELANCLLMAIAFRLEQANVSDQRDFIANVEWVEGGRA